MVSCKYCGKKHNVGFVSFRIAGTDGVTLELAKWADVFESEGFNCYYFAGELDRPEEVSFFSEMSHFLHPEILKLRKICFGKKTRKRSTSKRIHDIKRKLKTELYKFTRKYKIDILVPQNALTLPLNIPLGLALTEFIAETGYPTIAHHHDFFWERQQFLNNAVWDYINMAYPPHIPSMKHVVINSSQDNQLSLRTGISATVIPNVMDFENPPSPADKYAADVREALEVEEDELLILQPTRVVKRKGIEHAIEFVNRLNMKAKLVISHASGDEGHDYEQRVRVYSKMMGVKTNFVCEIINERRGTTESGKKIYTLQDIYPHADFVTYPSNIEGFGNAFLEAVYYKKPILVNTYSIYNTDIKPKGFKTVEIDGYVTEPAVRKARKVLQDAEYRQEMVDDNYEIAKRHFSYANLRQRLTPIIEDFMECRLDVYRREGNNND